MRQLVGQRSPFTRIGTVGILGDNRDGKAVAVFSGGASPPKSSGKLLTGYVGTPDGTLWVDAGLHVHHGC